MSDTAPIFDASLVVEALAPLAPGTVRVVYELSSLARAAPAQGLRPTPAIVVASERCAVSGPGGLGNDRTITETIALVIQVRQSAGADAEAANTLALIRAAAWEILEAARLHARWAPMRYAGGQLLAVEGGLYQWVDRYQTERQAPTRPRT